MHGANGQSPPRAFDRDRALLALLALGLALFGYQGLAGDAGGIRVIQDHTITLSLSRQLATYHEYHADFVYPLPAAIFKLMLGALGEGASSVLWTALSIAAGLWVAMAIASLLPGTPIGGRYGAALAGALALVYCIQWDLRAVNSNTVFLALVLWSAVWTLRGRGVAAGALLAGSVALKLYSLPLVAVLLVRRQHRALGWTLVWLGVLFVVVPALYFGPTTAARLTGLWLERVATASDPAGALAVTAYKVSLLQTFATLLGTTEGEPTAAAVGLAGGLGLGLAAVVAALVVRGARDAGAGEGPRVLLDVGLVLAAMLWLSPIAQPHHAVVLWPLAALTAQACLGPNRDPSRRAIALGVLTIVALAWIAAPAGTGKGIAFAISVPLLVAGAWLGPRPEA